MPFCPKCKFKYNEGVTKCPDCECDLVDEIEIPDDNEEIALNSLFKSNPQYVKKSDKYKDIHSSSLSLINVSVCGAIFLVLNAFSLLPIHFAFEGLSGGLFYVIMGTLFAVFFIGGLVSLRSANQIKSEIQSEEDLTKQIIEYITDKFSTESINVTSENEAEIYYERVEIIKSAINDKYGELNEAYLESLIEQIYEKLFD